MSEKEEGSLISWLREHKTTVWLFILLVVAAFCYLLAMWLEGKHTAGIADTVAERLAEEDELESISPTALSRILQEELDSEAHLSRLEELFVHIAIALLVAVILVLLVDASSAAEIERRVERYIGSVAESVWAAVLRRVLPEGIAREIDEVSRTRVIKRDCRYTLTFCRPYPGLGDDQIVLRRELVYELENITSGPERHPIRAVITSETPPVPVDGGEGEEISLPRHSGYSIDGKSVALEGVLYEDQDGNHFVLKDEVAIEEGVRREVYLCTEEAMPLQGKNTYTQAIPALGLSLVIKNDLSDLISVTNVTLSHPRGGEFTKKHDGSYRFNGGILPGQSISIFWSLAKK